MSRFPSNALNVNLIFGSLSSMVNGSSLTDASIWIAVHDHSILKNIPLKHHFSKEFVFKRLKLKFRNWIRLKYLRQWIVKLNQIWLTSVLVETLWHFVVFLRLNYKVIVAGVQLTKIRLFIFATSMWIVLFKHKTI